MSAIAKMSWKVKYFSKCGNVSLKFNQGESPLKIQLKNVKQKIHHEKSDMFLFINRVFYLSTIYFCRDKRIRLNSKTTI